METNEHATHEMDVMFQPHVVALTVGAGYRTVAIDVKYYFKNT